MKYPLDKWVTERQTVGYACMELKERTKSDENVCHLHTGEALRLHGVNVEWEEKLSRGPQGHFGQNVGE